MFPASLCEDVLQRKTQVSSTDDIVTQKKAHLNDTARDLGKGHAALIQRVQDDDKRRTEAPDDTDDDPCGEPTHAVNGTREEERERDQNEHDNRLVGIKSSGSVSERERKKIADQGDRGPRGEAEGLGKVGGIEVWIRDYDRFFIVRG